jgi:hypothetical protein
MKRTTLTKALGIGVALLLFGALGGCAAKVTGGSASTAKGSSGTVAHSSAAATVKPKTPTPTPTELPALPADALWRIRATATGNNGAIADLVETVYKPIAFTAADNTEITAQCPASGWPQNYPNPVSMHATVTATLRPGSKPWTQYSPEGIGFILGNLSAWTGNFYNMPSTDCGAATPLMIPGSANGVAPLSPASDPVGQLGGLGWYSGFYGFSITYDGNDSQPSGLITLSNCSLQLSQYATTANPGVVAWASEAQPSDDGDVCEYGPTD